MRTLLTILIYSFFIISINAQSIIYEYNLTVSEETFVEIENGTSFIYEDNGYLQFEPIEFENEFDLFDKPYDALYVEDLYFLDEAEEFQFFLTDVYLKLIDSTSNISYVISGEIGSRKLTVEYINVGIDDDTFIDNDAFINAQIIIYEGTDVIEFHFGECSVSNNLFEFGGPVIGLVDVKEIEDETAYAYTVLLEGSHKQPSLQHNVYDLEMDIDTLPHLDRLPDSGVKYTFTRGEVNTKELIFSTDLTYPNPVLDVLNIKSEGLNEYNKIFIYNANGRIVSKNDASDQIDVSMFPQGVYSLELIGHETLIRSRFVKL